MRVVAIVNEKGGTGKTTTAVNLAAALGKLGKKVLLIDMDGQGASSRWLGIEEDNRLADAILAGGGLEPIPEVLPGVWLAPGSGKLDSISHDLRPTQGGQLRKVIAELDGQFDTVLIDCPPSLGNRLIGNALLAATDAIVPVETSILALDGLRILLMMLDDIRDGFEHPIHLMGVLPCRFDSRTRLSRLVLAELRQSLGEKVFKTVIRETVRLQECPALGHSIFEYDPKCNGAVDYLALATEIIQGEARSNAEEHVDGNLHASEELSQLDQLTVQDFRKRAAKHFSSNSQKSAKSTSSDPKPVQEAQASEPQQEEFEEVQIEIKIGDELTAAAHVVQEQVIESPTTKGNDSSEWQEEDSSDDSPTVVDVVEDILNVNVPVQEPDEQEISEILADAPVVDIPVEDVTADWDDSQEEVQLQAPQDIDQPAERDDQAAFDEPEPARPRSIKPVLAGVPVILFIALATSGWFIFRGESSPQTAEASDWQKQAPIVTAVADPITPTVLASPQIEEVQAEIQQPAEAIIAEIETAADEVVAAVKVVDEKAFPTSAPAEIALAIEEIAKDEQPVQASVENQNQQQVAYRTSPDWLSLKGIMIGPRGGCALINNRAIKVGGSIGGATVIAVLPRTVEMELDGERFLLHLGSSSSSGQGSPAEPEQTAPQQQEEDSVDQS